MNPTEQRIHEVLRKLDEDDRTGEVLWRAQSDDGLIESSGNPNHSSSSPVPRSCM